MRENNSFSLRAHKGRYSIEKAREGQLIRNSKPHTEVKGGVPPSIFGNRTLSIYRRGEGQKETVILNSVLLVHLHIYLLY